MDNIIEIWGHEYIEQPLEAIKAMLRPVEVEIYIKSKAYYKQVGYTYYLDETDKIIYIKEDGKDKPYYVHIRFYLNMMWHRIPEDKKQAILTLTHT